MSAISPQLFTHGSSLNVREVTLSNRDSLQSYREKLARIILDEMYQFVGLLDATGMTLEINRAALEGAGIKLRDIQDKPFWEARWWQVSKETQEKQRELCGRAAKGEFIRCDMEIYGQSSGEETIIIDFSLMPVRDHAGKIVFLLAEGRNITEKQAAEAEIARKNDELQKLLEQIRHLDQLKSDLFANVSHELRTPLALILGPAESVLASGTNLTDVQRRDLGVIRHNAATLLKHVNDLLDLAKLDAGKMTMDYVDIDVARMVRTVAAHFDALAPQKSISYAVLVPDAARAEVDPEKMERVLLNLLSNAFKFTPEGGTIQCTLRINDSRFILTVQDSGPGIPPVMRNTIFERFRQAQGGTTREFGGTGLGLSIVKDFVDLHGGSISISDAPTGGTLVQVDVPLRAPEGSSVRTLGEPESVAAVGIAISGTVEELRSRENQILASGDEGKTKILIVEDHPEMRRFIAEVLSSEYRVVTAADGLEGLTSVAVERPDLVVTDLMMPKLGGDELVRRMRANKELPQLPVLVLSARADDELRLKLLADLVQDFLVKPFSAGELRARVRNLVAMKQTRDLLQEELASQTEDVASLTRELILNKRTLQESLKAERTLSALIENSPDFIGFASPQGQALFVNPAGRKFVGLEAEQVKLTSPRDYVVEDDQELLRAGIASALEKGNWEGEMRFRNFKTGAVIPMFQHIFEVKDTETGRQIGLATISRDITERRRSEKELRDVIETIPAVAWSILPDGSNAFSNRRWSEYTGLSGQHTAGSEWRAAIHPEDLPRHLERWRASLATGEPFENELRFRRADGKYRWHLCRGVPLRDEDGKTLKWYGVFNDIEDRKQAEEALRRSEKELRDLVENMPAMAGALLPDGSHAYLTKQWREYSGLSVAETDSKGWKPPVAVHPEDIDSHIEKFRAAAAAKKPFENEVRLRRAVDGEYRWFLVRVAPLCDERGTIVKWHGVLTDIEDRKSAEDALRRSEAYLAEGQRLTHTGSWALNVVSRRALHSSAEHTRMFGFDPEKGMPSFEDFLQRVHPEDREHVIETFRALMRSGGDLNLRYRIALPGGPVRYMHAIGHPVLRQSGATGEYVGITIDVTERRRLEQEREKLHKLEAELAHMNRVSTMGEMAASLAHEVKQPIAAAVMNAEVCLELLQRDQAHIPDLTDATSAMLRSAKRAADIIDSVRSLSRRGTPKRAEVVVNDVIREIDALLQNRARQNSADVHLHLKDNVPCVMGDRVQLQQVVMNLMLNAIEAMNDVGGELVVKSELTDAGDVLISVSDTGIGLPKENEGQIFEAFFTTKSQGSGMGLAISRSIVESHGGRLWATRNPDRGATFYVQLPPQVAEPS